MDVISERLTKLRDEKGATQEEVAEACGLSRVTLARYENGTRKPIPENLSRLAEYYGKTVDYLLGRSVILGYDADPQASSALVVDISSGLASGKTGDEAAKDCIMDKLDQLSVEERKLIEENIDFLLSRKKGKQG